MPCLLREGLEGVGKPPRPSLAPHILGKYTGPGHMHRESQSQAVVRRRQFREQFSKRRAKRGMPGGPRLARCLEDGSHRGWEVTASSWQVDRKPGAPGSCLWGHQPEGVTLAGWTSLDSRSKWMNNRKNLTSRSVLCWGCWIVAARSLLSD